MYQLCLERKEQNGKLMVPMVMKVTFTSRYNLFFFHLSHFIVIPILVFPFLSFSFNININIVKVCLLPEFPGGNRTLVGSWVVGDKPSGIFNSFSFLFFNLFIIINY